MNKTKIAFLAIFAGSIVAITLWNPNANSLQKSSTFLRDYGASKTAKKENNISKVCFNKKCFNVEIANTPKEHAIGLMNRKYLDSDSGMLFIFNAEDKYFFWMKNTLIPLDIIWLDKNKKIVFIKQNAKPCEADPCKTFGPNKNAKYVLEINNGLAEKIGIEEENYLEFR